MIGCNVYKTQFIVEQNQTSFCYIYLLYNLIAFCHFSYREDNDITLVEISN